MIIYNQKAKFILYGTGDCWDVSTKDPHAYDDYSDIRNNKSYNLSYFNKIFLANDIKILKEVFLNEHMCIENKCFYEYQRMGTGIMNCYGFLPMFITERKNLDEICVSLTNIYKRLYTELTENKKETLEKFSLVLTSLNIANCEFARGNCKEYLPIAKYIDQFTQNQALREYIYKDVYQNLEKFNVDHFKNYDEYSKHFNPDHNSIDTRLINKIKEQDQMYIKNREQNKIMPYINNDELPLEEQRKRFYDAYKEESIL